MSAAASEGDLSLPFPVEFLIRDTPRSLQSSRVAQWKRTVGGIAKAHVATLGEFFLLDDRPLAATILYFPPAPMPGDVDNIVKPILDGMIGVVYLDDHVLERVMVQKFEPGIEVVSPPQPSRWRRQSERTGP